VNPQLWWYLARATGIVAWILATLACLWGLALSTRALGNRPRPAWLMSLHRFLGGLTVVFVAGHIASLVADSYVHFGPADVLVPMASSYKPGAVAWGIVAFWALLAVELTSLAMRRLPRRVWHGIHFLSYAVALGSTVHALTAGTDGTNPAMRWAAVASVTSITFFTVYRAIAPRRRRGRESPVVALRPSKPTGRVA
jgi:DMSO/TMAO reductase YedYZ heme-binding membrane subunit